MSTCVVSRALIAWPLSARRASSTRAGSTGGGGAEVQHLHVDADRARALRPADPEAPGGEHERPVPAREQVGVRGLPRGMAVADVHGHVLRRAGDRAQVVPHRGDHLVQRAGVDVGCRPVHRLEHAVGHRGGAGDGKVGPPVSERDGRAHGNLRVGRRMAKAAGGGGQSAPRRTCSGGLRGGLRAPPSRARPAVAPGCRTQGRTAGREVRTQGRTPMTARRIVSLGGRGRPALPAGPRHQRRDAARVRSGAGVDGAPDPAGQVPRRFLRGAEQRGAPPRPAGGDGGRHAAQARDVPPARRRGVRRPRPRPCPRDGRAAARRAGRPAAPRARLAPVRAGGGR